MNRAMKIPLLASFVCTCLSAAEPMRDRISPDEFAKRRSDQPLAGVVPPAPTDGAAAQRTDTPSLISESEILGDGQRWTIAPKGALLHVPKALAGRVSGKPQGTLVSWLDFLRANGSWVIPAEMSIEQASGKAPLPKDRIKFWKSQDKIVVAVHRGGPISVRLDLENPDSPTP